LDAVAHLHGLIEGSVSVFKTHEIKSGKLVPKTPSPKGHEAAEQGVEADEAR
jgi:hypothetical protein